MNEIEKDMMLGMINILNMASDKYYNSNSPIMSDTEFDRRFEDLKQLEEETGFVYSNSPTINVGAPILTELKESIHAYPMLSLDKIHSTEELIKFANNKELVASIKLDGVSVALTYENGLLVKGESRGNGHIGNDITEHVKQFSNIPMKINKNNTYIVYGEAIIKDEDFIEINKNNEFKNSRNTISGVLNSLDTSLPSQRRAKFICWDIVEGGSNKNLYDNLNEAKELCFDVVPNWLATNLNPKNLQDNIDYVFDYAKEEGLPCDGVVFKFNDIEYGKSLGATSHHFKNGIAYKAQDNVARTKLIDIDWTLGKTGQITPTAVFEEVELEGTTVSRASVHNVSILTKLDLHIGDTIEVVKSNQIIPQVKRNISSEEREALKKDIGYIILPSKCPVCGGETEIAKANDSKVLICTNDNCRGKLLGKLTHFVSKNAMNIDGLSEATLGTFVKLGWIESFVDIYDLEKRFGYDITQLDGFGKKSVDKLFDAIEVSKYTTLDRFINALSIPLIGRSASKIIAKYFDYDADKFCETILKPNYIFDWESLEGFGATMSDSCYDYFKDNRDMIIELMSYMYFVKLSEDDNNSDKLKGMTFCITGSLNHFANRDELKNKIEILGGKVSGSVSAKTSYLINNDTESTSSKNKKAKELGVSIITEDDFIKMLS